MAFKTDFNDADFIASPFVDEVAKVSPGKAKKILDDGKIRGKAITAKQRGFFGAVAGGKSNMNEARAASIMRKVKTQRIVRRFLDERGTKAKVK